MALATRCPACSTIFRISTAQAAAKGGMVRCGQCRNVFNSLDALVRVEDLEVIEEIVVGPPSVPEPVEEPAPASTPPPSPSPSPPDAVVEETSASDTILLAETRDAPEVEADKAKAIISEWWLPEPKDMGKTYAPVIAVAEADRPVTGSFRDDAGQLLTGRRSETPAPAAGLTGTNPTFMRPDEALPPVHRAGRWVMATLSLLLAIVLAGQAAYLWRDELAARWSPAKGWLVAACATLQCKVDFPAHLDSITIESASIQTPSPNANLFTLTALLRNRDVVDVRYPYLTLVLTDVQDRPILRRALRPEDYLPANRDASSSVQPGFAAQSELPIRVTFELNGLRFAGYRLDKFYP